MPQFYTEGSREFSDPFVEAYVTTMLWTCEEEVGKDTDLLSPDLLESVSADLTFFRTKAFNLLWNKGLDPTQIAHDFWLTRNHHGCGFWDRPEIYGQENADRLTEIAQSFGESDPYLGDDGLIYV